MVLHRGEAAFSILRKFTKVAGEDVILAHRLLKNSIPSDEYILMTDRFADACHTLDESRVVQATEDVSGLGNVEIRYIDYDDRGEIIPTQRTFLEKFKLLMKLEGYTIKRWFAGPDTSFKSLQDV